MDNTARLSYHVTFWIPSLKNSLWASTKWLHNVFWSLWFTSFLPKSAWASYSLLHTKSCSFSLFFFSSLNVMLNSGSLSIAFSRKLYFTSVCSGKCCLGGDSSCSLLFYSESAVSTGSCFLFTELAFSSLFWWWKSGLHYPQWRVTSCFGCQYLSIVTGNHGVMMLPWIAVIQSMVFSFFSWYSWKVINRSGWYHDMSVGIEIWTLR